jgi:hypothetical protein
MLNSDKNISPEAVIFSSERLNCVGVSQRSDTPLKNRKSKSVLTKQEQRVANSPIADTLHKMIVYISFPPKVIEMFSNCQLRSLNKKYKE